MKPSVLVAIALLGFGAACTSQSISAQAGSGIAALPVPPGRAPVFGYELVKTLNHDHDAFTQGLQYVDGEFFEGTGLNGRSNIRRVQVDSGTVEQRQNVPQQYFGEGIAVLGDEIFELTWQSGVAFVYDKTTFAQKKQFRYSGEGWGLTTDGTQLIMSDGTPYLRFLDPATFEEKRRVAVMDGDEPVSELNELEFIKGEVWANVWQTDRIARIDPETGRVKAWLDLTGILPLADRVGVDVLNGIAYDEKGDRLFVTGKLWPKLFQIRVGAKK